MDVSLLVLADYASLSMEGKPNIMGVFTQVNAPSFPFTVPQLYVVVQFEAVPAEAGTEKAVRLVLTNVDGVQLLALDSQMTVPQPPRPGKRVGMLHILSLSGAVKFEGPGDYEFAAFVGGEPRKSVILTVNEIPHEGGA